MSVVFHKPLLYPFVSSFPCVFKVTVQYETEGKGPNDILSHMDGSEIKL